MGRVILHSDMNSFYASVECLYHPEVRDKPVAVAGDAEARHGIILAKNQHAKKYGIQTGEAIWQAQRKCPDLILFPPDFPKYLYFSKRAQQIYADYTDQIEPFGIDESWLDVSGSVGLFGNGLTIAQEISARIKQELGLTVSIGVSWNKIFAKLGSDYKKPDAITVFDHGNYQDLIWPLPASDLLYVGSATGRKLRNMAIYTIGDLAQTDIKYTRPRLGKMADVLYGFANGLDVSPIARVGDICPVKSVGNSCTAPHDLKCDEDAKMLITALGESVAMRLREQGLLARTVCISIRDCNLYSYERQCKLKQPTDITSEIIGTAILLFRANYNWQQPIRSLGVKVTDLTTGNGAVQLDFFTDEKLREKWEKIDKTVDWLRGRFGNNCVQRAVVLQDKAMAGIDAKAEHIIHPVGFF